MISLWRLTNRWLTWFHRWAGVVLCLLFAVWFASGAVLHFVGFPALSSEEQRAGSEAIEVALIHTAPEGALEKAPQSRDLKLISVAGRPIYVMKGTGRDVWHAVAGDTGELLPGFSSATAKFVAEAFSQQSAVRVSAPLDYDQWIVHQRFDPFRPLYRVRLNDSENTDLYVSSRTGEVVQRTRASERLWNWVGAVTHWIYFTPLRKSWPDWNQTVWWVSLVALLSSVVGTWLGIVRMTGNRAAGRRGLSPFRGWMRWHHLMGLFAGLIVVAWIFSGWLSMDHGRLFSPGEASPTQIDRLSGMSVLAVTRSVTMSALAKVMPASAVTFNAVAGRPFLTGYGPLVRAPRVLFLDQTPSETVGRISDSLLGAAIMTVWPASTPHVALDDDGSLYRRAESTPDSAVTFTDGKDLRAYIDPYSGRFLTIMNSSRRDYAWVYYALHTLQFPALIEHPFVRTALILALLLLGFVFSITGVILSYVRLRRDFA